MNDDTPVFDPDLKPPFEHARSHEPLLDQYERQVEVEFKGEIYLVRDNGAVCRKGRPEHRKRRQDDSWTFGRANNSTGYMQMGSHVVHRIVAFAFHQQPTKHHVVDHVDTNRRNNRADNLRWVTRLENVLLNPITRQRIIRAYGSLDAFFKNPSANVDVAPDLTWMRTVTREEAEESRKRLLEWAESDPPPRGRQIGEWIYRPKNSSAPTLERPRDTPSLTPMAVQRHWTTPAEFPSCPESLGADPLGEYATRLKEGTVVSRNTFGEALMENVGRNDALLAVLCRMPQDAIKDWAVLKVTVENGKFVHESVSTYFTQEGAQNAYCELLGLDRPYGNTIDDYS